MPNIFVKIEGGNKPSQPIPNSTINDFVDLEMEHPDEVVDTKPIDTDSPLTSNHTSQKKLMVQENNH